MSGKVAFKFPHPTSGEAYVGSPGYFFFKNLCQVSTIIKGRTSLCLAGYLVISPVQQIPLMQLQRRIARQWAETSRSALGGSFHVCVHSSLFIFLQNEWSHTQDIKNIGNEPILWGLAVLFLLYQKEEFLTVLLVIFNLKYISQRYFNLKHIEVQVLIHSLTHSKLTKNSK
jgi:hypothetical protein